MLENSKNNITFIDGMPYAVCLPDGGKQGQAEQSEFATLMRGAGLTDMHCMMRSWCSNRFVGTVLNEEEGFYWDAAGIVTHYDGRKENWNVDRSDSYSYGLGFRPVLVPLDPDTLKPAPDRFGDLLNGSLVQLGTLYMDDKALLNPVDPVSSPMPDLVGGFYPGDVPVYEKGASLRIGDTLKDEGTQIRFVVVGGKLVSDRVILGCVSHDDLEREFHLTKDVTRQHVNKKKKETRQQEDGPVSLWMRLGVSIDVTRDELEALKAENFSAQEMLMKLLCSGRCRIDGDTYFPEDQKDLEDELNFDLPNMPFTAQPHVKEQTASRQAPSLAQQIQSASSRAAGLSESHDAKLKDTEHNR